MNTKIDKKGFSSIIYFVTQVMFLKVGTTQILNSAGNGSIYSIILGSIISLVLLFFILRLYNFEKDLTLFKKIEKLYGNKLGTFINFVLFLIFTLLFIYLLWSINTYVQNKYLDKTPSYIIILLFLIPTIWCAILDIKVISKVSFSIFIISIIMVIFSISNLFMKIDLENFKPLFNTSLYIIIKNALVFSSYFVTPIFMIFLVPKNHISDSKNLDKTIFKFFILSIINYLLIFVFIIGIFGIELSKVFSYPEYSLMKKVNYFDFIQHIENIATIQFLYCFFISNVICLNFLKGYLIHIKKYKKIIFFVIILLCLFLSQIIFKNTTIGYNFIKKYFNIICSLPLFLLLIISNIIINKKNNK